MKFLLLADRGEAADSSMNIHVSAGGGAGGSIWIEADEFVTTGINYVTVLKQHILDAQVTPSMLNLSLVCLTISKMS